MNGRCPPVEDLPGLAALPATDSRRAHLRDCPRCRAILLSYNVFMDEAAAAATPGRERAEARLAACLSGLGAGDGEEVAVEHPDGQATRRQHRSPRPRPLVRPLPVALALAAALVALVALRAALRPGPEGEGPPRLRGAAEAPAGAAAWKLAVSAPEADGSLVLSWAAPTAGPAAGSPAGLEYRVEIYDAGLGRIASLGPTPALEMTVPAARLRALGAALKPWRWRVVALRDGDPVARSPMALLDAGP